MIPRILTFHKLSSTVTWGSTNQSPRRFRKLLLALGAGGYRLAPLHEVVQGTAGERAVAITFDDGYRHLADELPPLMEELGFRPTIFVPTRYIGLPNDWDYCRVLRCDPHLDREQIRHLAQKGVSFGTHGHTHQPLTDVPPEKLTAEIAEPRKILEDITGQPVNSISYPFGRINERVLAAVEEAGYQYGFTTFFPGPEDSPLTIGRQGVWFFDTALSVSRKLEPGTLGYRFERTKADLARRLSAGTGLFNRLVGNTLFD